MSVSKPTSVPDKHEHDWQRAPDRDLISTPMNGGGFVDLVLWCSKCGKAKTERVDFPLRNGQPR